MLVNLASAISGGMMRKGAIIHTWASRTTQKVWKGITSEWEPEDTRKHVIRKEGGRTQGQHRGSLLVYQYLATTINYYPATLPSTLPQGYCTITWAHYAIVANKPFHQYIIGIIRLVYHTWIHLYVIIRVSHYFCTSLHQYPITPLQGCITTLWCQYTTS